METGLNVAMDNPAFSGCHSPVRKGYGYDAAKVKRLIISHKL